MGKNDFQARQKAMKEGFFKAGLDCGRQQVIDMLSLVLRDPQYVKKDIFGGERLVIIVEGIYDYLDKYHLAWQKDDETDYLQKQLDSNLAEAYGEKLHDSFHLRYPYAPEYDYTTGRWKK